jgi:hypothetical protein
MLKYYGSWEQMQKNLVDAVRDARTKKNISPETLDRRCGFFDVKTVDFEKDSHLMTSRIFSAASFVLDLTVDGVISPKLSEDDKKEIISYMQESGGGVVSADVAYEDQFQCFGLMQALQEMDEEAALFSKGTIK